MPVEQLTSTREKQILHDCQEALGYRFRHPQLLRAALTHTSGANTRLASLERLEFLGDAVLGLVTCELLFRRFPELQEGDLTKIKSVVVSRATCAQLSQELGLGDYIFLGRGMHIHGPATANLLADVFESVVGAIYLDGGLEPAKQFILRLMVTEVDRAAKNIAESNAKTLLQQVGQRKFGGTPRYEVLDEQGPAHARSFKVAVEIDRHFFPAAWGPSKKEAEIKAALNALADIEGKPLPHPCGD